MSSICQSYWRPDSCTHTKTRGGGGVISSSILSQSVLAVTPSRQLVGPLLSWSKASQLPLTPMVPKNRTASHRKQAKGPLLVGNW